MNVEAQDQERSIISKRETCILDAIRRTQFGSVEIVIHDGQIVQIERKEKTRFA